jgi:small-conductance mechanosensitive channel
LAGFVSSIKRFVLIIVLLVLVAFGIVVADYLFASPARLTSLTTPPPDQILRTLIVISFGLIIMLFIRRSKPLLSKYLGAHLATFFQYFMILVVGIIVIFASLDIFQVSPTTLLVGGGIASIIIGLVVSSVVGNILSGMFLSMSHPFNVGDTVVVNGIPGRVEEIGTLVTRIRNDIGGLVVIPNTAISQGNIIITTFPASEATALSRLPYSQGDRVYTTYMNEGGVVKELTPFQTKILLDSGRELTFLNSTVLTGNVAVAKISKSS